MASFPLYTWPMLQNPNNVFTLPMFFFNAVLTDLANNFITYFMNFEIVTVFMLWQYNGRECCCNTPSLAYIFSPMVPKENNAVFSP